MTSVPPNHFDRAKPFYPIVMNYLFLLHGVLELSSRAAITLLNATQRNNAQGGVTKLTEYDVQRLRTSKPTELISNLRLKCQLGTDIEIDANGLVEELIRSGDYVLASTMRAAGSVLILAWETTSVFHDNGELWEFLRHCRNAAAHNGSFYFKPKEPRHLARWQTFDIKRSLHGTPLFGSTKNPGLLCPGDPVRLLWDIEQAYPAIKL